MSAGDLLPSGLPENPERPARKGWRLALRAFLRGLLTLMAILVLIAAVAAAIYWGVPALYRRFVIPIEENATRLERLEASQEQANQRMQQNMDALQARLATLEAHSDQEALAIAALQSQLEEAQKALADRLEGSQSDLASAMDRLEALDRSLGEISSQVDRLSADREADQDALRAIVEQGDAQAAALEGLRREIQIVRAMELLIRSRLFLGQSNFGLARQDIQAARDLLAALIPRLPAYQVNAMEAILVRLDLALGNLPERPVLAADDLEIAWELLVLGLPGEAATGLPSATATPSLTPSMEMLATATWTPTITMTLAITPTPTGQETASPSPSPTPGGETAP